MGGGREKDFEVFLPDEVGGENAKSWIISCVTRFRPISLRWPCHAVTHQDV